MDDLSKTYDIQEFKTETCKCGRVVKVMSYTHKITGRVTIAADECECVKERNKQEDEQLKKVTREIFKQKCDKFFPFLKCDPEIEEHTFDNFIVEKGTEQAFNEAKKVTFSYWGMYGINLIGSYGNGKTRLLKTMGYESYKKDKIVIFTEYARIFDRIFATKEQGNMESKKDLLDCLMGCDELFIDELGVGSNSAAKEDLFLNILNERRRRNKRTHFSMNENDAKLNLSGRILSRLFEFARPVVNNGKDYRPMMLKKKLEAESWGEQIKAHA